jgi:hypothetical protein
VNVKATTAKPLSKPIENLNGHPVRFQYSEFPTRRLKHKYTVRVT